MKITKCWIKNYKSIGSDKNILNFEDDVTVLIGKNESGKSNILEATGALSFLKPLPAHFVSSTTRWSEEEVSIEMELEFWDGEIDSDKKLSSKITNFKFGYSEVTFEGAFSELIGNDYGMSSIVNRLDGIKRDANIWGNDSSRRRQIDDIINRMKRANEKMIFNYLKDGENLKSWIGNDEARKDVGRDIDHFYQRLDKYYSMLPQFYFKSSSEVFKDSYTLEELMVEMDRGAGILYNFMNTSKISKEEIEKAFNGANSGIKRNAQRAITANANEFIANGFNEFYEKNNGDLKIEFDISVQANAMNFFVVSNKKDLMQFSERSNGLRWYLSLYIDIVAEGASTEATVFLLDEPGVFLHVDAQRELLSLFENLSDGNNQVVYTTHSPYMIKGDSLNRIRAIEKDVNGNTSIYRTVTNPELSRSSKMETLSPLIYAMGADLKYQIGPAMERNIITEGASDYFYIQAMLKSLKVKNPPNMLPLIGVQNAKNVASILIGWGCDFEFLFDYDKAGLKEYDDMEKYGIELANKVTFVNGKKEPDRDQMRNSPVTIEDLVSDSIYAKLGFPRDSEGFSSLKKVISREFKERIDHDELKPDEETVERFKKLFTHLNII